MNRQNAPFAPTTSHPLATAIPAAEQPAPHCHKARCTCAETTSPMPKPVGLQLLQREVWHRQHQHAVRIQSNSRASICEAEMMALVHGILAKGPRA
jgi:hypothetical protein